MAQDLVTTLAGPARPMADLLAAAERALAGAGERLPLRITARSGEDFANTFIRVDAAAVGRLVAGGELRRLVEGIASVAEGTGAVAGFLSPELDLLDTSVEAAINQASFAALGLVSRSRMTRDEVADLVVTECELWELPGFWALVDAGYFELVARSKHR